MRRSQSHSTKPVEDTDGIHIAKDWYTTLPWFAVLTPSLLALGCRRRHLEEGLPQHVPIRLSHTDVIFSSCCTKCSLFAMLPRVLVSNDGSWALRAKLVLLASPFIVIAKIVTYPESKKKKKNCATDQRDHATAAHRSSPRIESPKSTKRSEKLRHRLGDYFGSDTSVCQKASATALRIFSEGDGVVMGRSGAADYIDKILRENLRMAEPRSVFC